MAGDALQVLSLRERLFASRIKVRFCSFDCSQQAAYFRNKQRFMEKHSKPIECKQCGCSFVPHAIGDRMRKKFCSEKCGKDWWTDFRRRAKRAGSADHIRDGMCLSGWVAVQASNQPIDKALKFPDPMWCDR